MWMTGRGVPSKIATVSSLPLMYSSTSSSSPCSPARRTAAGSSAASCTISTPTEDPSQGGLTTQGTGMLGS